MPSPNYIGDCGWTRQGRTRHGITDDGLVFYEIPYRGRLDREAKFRATWQKGDACPITEFQHLTLRTGVTITSNDGISGEAILRFEGPDDTTGSFGEAQDTEEWYDEWQEVDLQPTVTGLKRGRYAYLAPVFVASYVQDTRRDTSNPKFTTSAVLRPESTVQPQKLVAWKDGAEPLTAEQIIVEHSNSDVWKVKAIAGFVRITREADDVYRHEEMHMYRLEAAPGTLTE